MRKLAAMVLCGIFAAAALAQDRATGTNDVYYSSVHSAPARVKDVVTERHDETGVSLMDRQRVFAQLADLVAEQVTVEGAREVAAAWHRGFSNGVEELRAALSSTPTNGVYLGLEFPYDPSVSRAAIDIYVASNHYDAVSGYDLFWIHFNHQLPKPSMEVPYQYTGGVVRVAGTWAPHGTTAHWTNVYTIARRGYTYDNCHLLFVKRPPELVGASMNLRPFGSFGNPETGISWGKVQTTYNGRASLTATLFDGTQDWEFQNGCLLSKTTPESSP